MLAVVTIIAQLLYDNNFLIGASLSEPHIDEKYGSRVWYMMMIMMRPSRYRKYTLLQITENFVASWINLNMSLVLRIESSSSQSSSVNGGVLTRTARRRTAMPELKTRPWTVYLLDGHNDDGDHSRT